MAAIFEPHHRQPAPAGRPQLRLVPSGEGYDQDANWLRVRQVVALAVLALLVMAAAVAVGRGGLAVLAPAPPAASSVASGSAVAGASVLVQPGDTLWSIARDLRPNGDVRGLVDQLVAVNGTAPLVPGDRVVVPS